MASGNGKHKRDGAVILPFGPRQMPRPLALALIQRLAAADQFILVPKAKMNMADREISDTQVMLVLKEGEMNEGPWKDECGNWRCRLRKRCAGQLIRVIVAIQDESFLYVISVH